MDKTINSWIIEAKNRLSKVSETSSLDIQVILAYHLNRERSWVLSHPEYGLSQTDVTNLDASLSMLEQGFPLPYITGVSHFYGLEFFVSPDVLIPRPETEILVDHAISWLQNHGSDQFVLDIGTGSGCIAASIAINHPGPPLLGVDLSAAALRIARQNLIRHNISDRCSLLRGDLSTAIMGNFNLICANLPYIPTSKLQFLDVTKNEPVTALDGGSDGLALINRLLEDLTRITAEDFCILLEIESEQGKPAKDLAYQFFHDADISIKKDLSDLDRLLIIKRNS